MFLKKLLKINKNFNSQHFALLSASLLAVIALSLGTVSAGAHYTSITQHNSQKPVLPKQVTLVEQGQRINLTPTELGWQLDTKRITAASQPKGLTLGSKLTLAGKQVNPLAGNSFFKNTNVPAYTKVNQAVLVKKITEISDATQKPPVDAKIITQNGDYVVSPAVVGSRVDVNQAVVTIKSALFDRKTIINLPSVSVAPTVTEASLQPQLQQMKAQRAAALVAKAAKPATPHSCADNPTGRQLILVSLGQQHLWACSGSSQAYDTAITSGAYLAGDATPTGTWHIYSKATNIHLVGPTWDDPVSYWMAFYSDYGFHDSSWQTFPYGSADYAAQGSHGCVHIPADAMAWLYGWAPVGTTVTING